MLSTVGHDTPNTAMTGAPEPLMTTAGAARYLSVGKSTLEQYRVKGGGPNYIKVAHSVRYRRSDLDEWIAARVTTSTSAAQKAA